MAELGRRIAQQRRKLDGQLLELLRQLFAADLVVVNAHYQDLVTVLLGQAIELGDLMATGGTPDRPVIDH